MSDHYDPDLAAYDAAAEAEAIVAFHAERARLLKRREDAYAKKLPPGNYDPDWEAAKQEYAEFRTAMKQLAEDAGTRKAGVSTAPPLPAPVLED